MSSPVPDHIVIVVEENHSYSEIIGNPQAPFINSLAAQGTLFTETFAITHPSEPNYFALFTGSTQGITDDGTYLFSVPTLAAELQQAGYSFAGYAESGSPQKHNPWQSFVDSQSTGVDFSQFPTDFTKLPTVSFVIPNLTDDMHDGSVAQGDQWLSQNLAAYANWATTHNSLLVLTFDEDDGTDNNHIATLVVGDGVGVGANNQSVDHYSLLHTIESLYGLPALGASADASIMSFFGPPLPVPATVIQAEYLAITRTSLPSDQASAEASAIAAGTTTETQYVNGLLSQAANTTIPAVVVEGSMYNAVGTSAEVTQLATQYLPAQIITATQNGFNPQIYACEVLGLAFAFSDENGGSGFANNFGSSNSSMPASAAGDAAFAAAAASAIFGADANADTPNAILGFVINWEAFYTGFGIPGIVNATADQIDLAARGAGWGDAVGVALANNLGPLPGQATIFLEDAAQGTAIYSASLASQPTAGPFQAAGAASSSGNVASNVELTGVAAPFDHTLM